MKVTYTKVAKELAYWLPIARYFFPRYFYCFNVPQLLALTQLLESTRKVPGSIVEVGCYNGATTIWLNRYMTDSNFEKPYVAIDTFEGFTREDVGVETESRGKHTRYFQSFRANKKKWFDATMRWNGIRRVRSIKADINYFDLRSLAPLSFVLLDVDLYRPSAKALPELTGALSPGGIMVVDDCTTADVRWDGADQAYKEFMRNLERPTEIVCEKLGIVRA